MLLQLIANGLINGIIIAVMSLGYALVYNTTKIFHIAYAVLFMIAPYFVLTFFKTYNFNIFISVFLALFCTIVIGLAIEKLVYQPLESKKSSLNVILIASIGVMIVCINVIAMIYGNETKIINSELAKSYKLGDIILTSNQILQFLIGLVLIIAFQLILKFTQLGIKTRALSDDAKLSRIFALDVKRFRLVLFAISSFMAAASGILIAWDIGMDPYIGMPIYLSAVIALIIGGIGKFNGAIIGAILIGLLQSLVIWKFSSNWQDALSFGVLILFLIFRPQGIFGEQQRLV